MHTAAVNIAEIGGAILLAAGVVTILNWSLHRAGAVSSKVARVGVRSLGRQVGKVRARNRNASLTSD
jgi:hypothetical protein